MISVPEVAAALGVADTTVTGRMSAACSKRPAPGGRPISSSSSPDVRRRSPADFAIRYLPHRHGPAAWRKRRVTEMPHHIELR
jgi:hypothetical protein